MTKDSSQGIMTKVFKDDAPRELYESSDQIIILVDPDVFKNLSNIDLGKKVEKKGKFNYLSWASAWAEVKKLYPEASFHVFPQVMDELGNTRFWHDDGKTGWVEVSVTIGGNTIKEYLAIMDMSNRAIPADQITSVEANKSMKRCLVKACALHGLGLYIFDGEDLPEGAAEVIALKESIKVLADKKAKQSEKAQAEVGRLCFEAEKKAFPDAPVKDIHGDFRNIDDVEILTWLERQLKAVRK